MDGRTDGGRVDGMEGIVNFGMAKVGLTEVPITIGTIIASKHNYSLRHSLDNAKQISADRGSASS